MFDWLKRLVRRRRDDGSWPRHLFVRIDGKGLGWAGEVEDEAAVDQLVSDVVGKHIEETGDVTFAQSWTSKPRFFSKREREAFAAGVRNLMTNPYDASLPARFKVVGYWSGLVFFAGKTYDDPEAAWREAKALNRDISADAIAVYDDGKGAEHMEKFIPAPKRSYRLDEGVKDA